MHAFGLKEEPQLYAIGWDYAAERFIHVRLMDLITLNRRALADRKPPLQFAILGLSDSHEAIDLTGQNDE